MKLQVLRTTDAEEARRRVAAGGRLRRVAHDMVLEPLVVPAGAAARPQRLRLEPLDPLTADPAELATAAAAATPEAHVDHLAWPGLEERVDYWARLLSGGVCGPVLQDSLLARDALGRLAGALVLTAMPAAAWWPEGSWVAEVLVTPPEQGRGLGAGLLAAGIGGRAAAGEARMGLTVTDGNPALRLYRRLGFARFRTLYVVELG